jgi:hypothetical protein
MLVPWNSYSVTALIHHAITIVLQALWRSSVNLVVFSVLSAAIRHDRGAQASNDLLNSQCRNSKKGKIEAIIRRGTVQ